jgi:hypothetical protein
MQNRCKIQNKIAARYIIGANTEKVHNTNTSIHAIHHWNDAAMSIP